MLVGELVGLRARIEADVPVLHAEFHDDEPTWSRVHSEPWRPIPLDSEKSPYVVSEPSDRFTSFSVVRLKDRELIGGALLWGIDSHNRTAHLGLSLFASSRGHGHAVDVVRVLCRYGFTIRGLNRLQVDTLADNAAMIATAEKAGFVREATLRKSAWVAGEFIDEVLLGQLAADWKG